MREVQKAVGVDAAETHSQEPGPRVRPAAKRFLLGSLEQLRSLPGGVADQETRAVQSAYEIPGRLRRDRLRRELAVEEPLQFGDRDRFAKPFHQRVFLG